jgi:hypothetical protein
MHLTLIIHPTTHPSRWRATLGDSTVCTSHQPLVDGARELLKRGMDGDLLLTMRHVDKTYDSFEPRPIKDLARVTYVESNRDGIIQTEWKPFDKE